MIWWTVRFHAFWIKSRKIDRIVLVFDIADAAVEFSLVDSRSSVEGEDEAELRIVVAVGVWLFGDSE